jgi:hypothetical protein
MGRSTAKTLTARFGFQDPDLQTPKHDAIICWFEENALELVKPWAHKQTAWEPANVEQIVETLHSYEAPCEIPPYPMDSKDAPRISKCEWEPIVTKRTGTARLGFMDLQVTVTFPYLALDTRITDGAIDHNKKAEKRLDMAASCNWDDDELRRYRTPIPWEFEELVYTRVLRDRSDDYQMVLVPRLLPSVLSKSQHFWIEAKPTIPSLGELFRQLNVYAEGISKDSIIVVSPDDRHAQRVRDQGYKFIKAPEEL